MYARIFPRYYRRRGILRRPKFDKKYFKIASYSFAVLALCILLNRFLDNIGGFFGTVGSLLMAVKGILITFIYGFFIAFFFTPLVNFQMCIRDSHIPCVICMAVCISFASSYRNFSFRYYILFLFFRQVKFSGVERFLPIIAVCFHHFKRTSYRLSLIHIQMCIRDRNEFFLFRRSFQ